MELEIGWRLFAAIVLTALFVCAAIHTPRKKEDPKP